MPASSSPSQGLISSSAARELIRLGRCAIEHWLSGTAETDSGKPYPDLMRHFGMFVTLRKSGALRGCLGELYPNDPVFRLIKRLAVASASTDPRFTPLQKDEWPKIKLEVSLLTPPAPVSSPKQVEIGRHGILIRKGNRTGVYLPEVAVEQHWNAEMFVRHCAEHKAGLSPGEWPAAELFTFTTQHIEEV